MTSAKKPAAVPARDTREFDVIIQGATSFVGQLLADYLWKNYASKGDIKLALAGRNAEKLAQVKTDIGADDGDLPLFVGDASDQAFLNELATKTRVISSTVGPYALYGNEMVAACANNGTDYCDLTGEPQWIARMVDAWNDKAAETGARIVHSCGFDSIPSDLGVQFLEEKAGEKFGRPLNRVGLRVRAMRGGASGGTVASGLNALEESRRDPAVAKVMKNPHALAPADMRKGERQPATNNFGLDDITGEWLAPFIMASINTRIVHRSHALQGLPYGKDFRYDEAMPMGKGLAGRLKATSTVAGMGGFMLGASFGPTRGLLEKFVLPKPGEGPSKSQRENGFYKLRVVGKNDEGDKLAATVTGDMDPGYGSTSKMLGESAMCLLRDVDETGGGSLTPATAMGDKLRQRLIDNAGLTFDIAND